jgi:hypothetical protein
MYFVSSSAPRRNAAAALLLLLAVVPALRCKPAERALTDRDRLIGLWRLERLGGGRVSSTNRAGWAIAFFADGRWRYGGSFAGTSIIASTYKRVVQMPKRN